MWWPWWSRVCRVVLWSILTPHTTSCIEIMLKTIGIRNSLWNSELPNRPWAAMIASRSVLANSKLHSLGRQTRAATTSVRDWQVRNGVLCKSLQTIRQAGSRLQQQPAFQILPSTVKGKVNWQSKPLWNSILASAGSQELPKTRWNMHSSACRKTFFSVFVSSISFHTSFWASLSQTWNESQSYLTDIAVVC